MSTPPIPLDQAEQLKLTATIAAGLIASGKYHYENSDGLKSFDVGETWESDGTLRRRPLEVSCDAYHILRDLWLEILSA